jgi:hypothetical protein
VKPLALDLCCGKGGWAKGLIAAGWNVIGVDNKDFSGAYPGLFVLSDLLIWRDFRKLKPDLIVASTPCEEFSRHGMPWTRKRNPPPPDLRLWHRAQYIAGVLSVPLVQENVRFAQPFVGKAVANCGPFYLWGNVPSPLPKFRGKPKQSYGSKQQVERAVIPFDLAFCIGEFFK